MSGPNADEGSNGITINVQKKATSLLNAVINIIDVELFQNALLPAIQMTSMRKA